MGELASFGCAISWSLGLICYKKCSDRYDPIVLSLWACLFAYFAMLPLIPLFGAAEFSHASSEDCLRLVASAVLGTFAGGVLVLYSLRMVGAGVTGLLETCYTPFVILLSFFLLSERLTASQYLGTGLILVAVSVINSMGKRNTQKKALWTLGIVCGIVCQFSIALSIVLIKPVLLRFSALWVLHVRIGIAIGLFSLICILGKRFRRETLQMGKSIPNGYLLAGIVLCECVATGFWLLGTKLISASLSSIIYQSSTVMTVLLAAFFLKEPVRARTVAATVLACVGVLLAVI